MVVEHAQLCNQTRWKLRACALSAADRLLHAIPHTFSDALTMTDDGLGSFDPDRAPAIVFHQADPEKAERAAIRMQPQRVSDIGAALPAVAWQGIPSTYIVCTEDRSIPPDYQQLCATQRATAKIEVPWDHVPSLSHPGELAQIFAGISAEVANA